MSNKKKLFGYKNKTSELIQKFGIEIGDYVHIAVGEEFYEGILIPRSEFSSDEHLVLKLKSGYNIGIKITSNIRIKKISEGLKPTFISPPVPKQNPKLSSIVIISTGGTIASRVDYRTGAVRPALTASDLYNTVPELSEIANIEAKILFSTFSENITPKNWGELAKSIAKQISGDINGVVVSHGTDTMGYTAAALSFALQKLPIPIILVGSQRSSDRPSSDAATNLMGAVNFAAKGPFAEVAVVMHETISDASIQISRGVKTRKCHTSRRDAFKSINTPLLAKVKNQKIIMLTENYLKRDPERRLSLKPKFDDKVALIKFYPGLDSSLIDWYVEKGFKGLIFEGTGLGHIGKYCFKSIKNAIKRNVIVAMSSQCIWGRVNMNIYNQGRDLLSFGVIPLEDMLPETAIVKLMWLFGQTQNLEEIKRLLQTNFIGEITSRSFPQSIS